VADYIDAVHCDYFKTEVASKEEGKKPSAPYLKTEQLGTLFRPTPDDDSIEQASLVRCEDNFKSLVTSQIATIKAEGKEIDSEELTGGSFTLLKTCLYAQKWIAFKILILQLLQVVNGAATPFIMHKLTNLMEQENTEASIAMTDNQNVNSLINDDLL